MPPAGGQLTFWVDRDTEPNWDFMFVEAHPVGSNDWTTLPDLNGHTDASTGIGVPLLALAAPVPRALPDRHGEGLLADRHHGHVAGRSGASNGYEQWAVDLAPYAGTQVEVSITLRERRHHPAPRRVVDDMTVPGGAGSTSFENDGNTLDGWTRPGRAGRQRAEPQRLERGAAGDVPSVGTIAAGALARQPEIIDFLSGIFGDYPFSAAGGIVDDLEGLGFALETQTRPVYSLDFFNDLGDPTDSVVVHELAHQWTVDHVALAAWQHIWLNEGFATYTEWLWSEDQGRATAQDSSTSTRRSRRTYPFWKLTIGDPGPGPPVRRRGLRPRRRDPARPAAADRRRRRSSGCCGAWIAPEAGGNATIPEFIALAERLSGQNLDGFFDEWLFTAAKPASLPAVASAASHVVGGRAPARGAGRAQGGRAAPLSELTYREHRAPAALAPWLACTWERRDGGGAPVRVVPDGCIDIVWTQGRGARVVGPNTTAFLVALDAGVASSARGCGPGAAPALLGVDAASLRDGSVALADVWGDDAGRLEDRLERSGDSGQPRVEVLLAALDDCARRAAAPDPLVHAAVERLRDPVARVETLARELDVSARQLRRRFDAAVGYGPKRLARVLRLERALARARARRRARAGRSGRRLCRSGAPHARLPRPGRRAAVGARLRPSTSVSYKTAAVASARITS